MKKIYLQIQYEKNKTAKAYILDLSRSGMGFAGSKLLKKGLNIVIIPKDKVLPRLAAEIIYISKIPRKNYNYRTGVKFINLNQKQRGCLGKFINKFERRGKKINF